MNSLPNILSLSRIPMGLIVVVCYSNTNSTFYLLTIFVLFLSIISDFLDGKLARALGCSSKKGYILDGLGDRVVYISCFLAFLSIGQMSSLIAWLLIIKEICLYATRLIEDCWQGEEGIARKFSLIYAFCVRLLIFVHLVITANQIWPNYIDILLVYDLLPFITMTTIFSSYIQLFIILRRVL